jgi:DUF4097 and DUF4098 domain-containing protein YvlB
MLGKITMYTKQIGQMKHSKRAPGWLLLSAAILLFLSTGLAGCIVGLDTFRATETVVDSFTTGSQPTIIVETFNGKIDVQVGSDSQVAVTVTKTGSGSSQSDAEADLINVEVKLTQSGDTIRITARRTGSRLANNSGAEIELTVPEASILDLTTSNGGITSNGVTGDLKLTTSNGKLIVSGGQGLQELTSSNGSIQVKAQSARVNAQTSNGSISFSGSLAQGENEFGTSNGSIEIDLPEDSQFNIDARTSNGRVSTEFPVAFSGTSRDNELRGSVGDNPTTSITAETSNGSIKLSKTR